MYNLHMYNTVVYPMVHVYYIYRTTCVIQVYILHMNYMYRTTCVIQVYILHMHYMYITTCVIRAVLIHYFLLAISSAYHRDTRDNICYCRQVQ